MFITRFIIMNVVVDHDDACHFIVGRDRTTTEQGVGDEKGCSERKQK